MLDTMPVRVVFNVAYAMLVDGLDGEGRTALDADLYGFADDEAEANKRFQRELMSGGED